ncbi:MAG: hypothetical protein P8L37_04470 [Phycisphaerales bacterium]|nr:hypothetical protein [Phycisphaerales bacterium]
MLLYAGIDEAGYGPMLGPLCVGRALFAIEDCDPNLGAPDLWARLDHAVCRGRRDHGKRIAVDDSKKLKSSNKGSIHPLHHLERGVLAFLGVTRDSMDWFESLTDEDVLAVLGAQVPPHAWYTGKTELPVGEDRGLLRIATSRLQRSMIDAGVTCRSLACEIIDADAFNLQVDRTGNKAHVNFAAVLRHIEHLRHHHPEDDLHVVVDRQGGRTTYRRDLQQAWPEDTLKVLDEAPALCRYRLDSTNRAACSITFAQAGDSRHLPISLASMAAKYTRELLMLRLNRWFAATKPDLKPTAGYVQDARRYLQDIETILESKSIDRSNLIRVC